MTRLFLHALVISLLLAMSFAQSAHAWIRSPATTFATLPAGSAHPEGITADAQGNIYVTTFAINGTPTGNGQLFVFGHDGKLVRQVNVANSSTLLLDLAFHPISGALLVIDFGGQKVLSVDPVSGASTLFATIPGGASAGPNVLTFDGAGNVYISDSFQGIIWRTGSAGGVPTPWVTSALLTTTCVPPFGANGLAFNQARTALFVANTGNDTVVKIGVNNGKSNNPTAGPVIVFVNSINGADGLIVDDDDNIWVCANQADEIVVIEP